MSLKMGWWICNAARWRESKAAEMSTSHSLHPTEY